MCVVELLISMSKTLETILEKDIESAIEKVHSGCGLAGRPSAVNYSTVLLLVASNRQTYNHTNG